MNCGLKWREVRRSDLNFVGRFWDGDRPDSPMNYKYGVLAEIAQAGPNTYYIVLCDGGPKTFENGEMQTMQIVHNADGTLADGLSIDDLADMVRAAGEALESQLEPENWGQFSGPMAAQSLGLLLASVGSFDFARLMRAREAAGNF